MHISRAGIDDVADVSRLFDEYRQFYAQAPAYTACERYIKARLTHDESVIFVARAADREILGFTQLYRSFCSVEMRAICYLYDLYVAVDARRTGVGRALLERAREFADAAGAVRLTLETQTGNTAGQALYESLGWKRDVEFFTYHLEL
ncbi:MAG: GNAT family N-acetyltransferase [Gammaproteobacteria bacterium]|nr:MAG: GNAT family N-acetyltransferase [Gammaproteobacteria bacterium]